MPTLYHGTTAIFDKPELNRAATDFSNSQYGYGFYAGDNGNAAWERISDKIDLKQPAIIYHMDVPDEEIEKNWLHSDRKPTPEQTDRIIEELRRAGKTSKADNFAADRDDLTGGKIQANMGGREGAEILSRAGIDGYVEGSYYVFINKDKLPEMNVQTTYNIPKEDVVRELDAIKEEKKRVYNADDFPKYGAQDFKSDSAQKAYGDLNRSLKDPALSAQYMELVEMTKDPEKFKFNGGYGVREALGVGVQRAFMSDSDHKYFGTTLLNMKESLQENSVIGLPPEFADKLDKFIDKMSDSPTVKQYLKDSPDQNAAKKFFENKEGKSIVSIEFGENKSMLHVPDIEAHGLSKTLGHMANKANGIAGMVIGAGAVGAALVESGPASAAETAYSTIVPYGETQIDIARGDATAAAKSAAVETGSWGGAIAGAASGTLVGGPAGGVVGGVVGSFGGGAVVDTLIDPPKIETIPLDEAHKRLSGLNNDMVETMSPETQSLYNLKDHPDKFSEQYGELAKTGSIDEVSADLGRIVNPNDTSGLVNNAAIENRQKVAVNLAMNP